MLQETVAEFSKVFNLAQEHLPYLLKIIGFTWLFNLFNFAIKGRLNVFGLIPRTIIGLPGIYTSPFLHQNFNHLFFNTIPFFALGLFLLAFGKSTFIAATFFIATLKGLVTWVAGRNRTVYIGASGVVSGYFGFIMGLAYYSPGVISIILALVALYYFGSIISGIIPTSEKISWEGHLAGLVAGWITIYLFMYKPEFKIWLIHLLGLT